MLSTDPWRVNVGDPVTALSAAPDGRIAVAGAEGAVTLLSAGGSVEHQRSLSLGCLTVSWSPRGNRIAVGSIHGLDVLDTDGAVVASHHGGWCSAVAWSSDGARLAAGVGRAAVVLDADGTVLLSTDRDNTVTGVAWVKRRVATAAYGGVHVISRGAAPDIMPFTGSLLALAISPDNRWAASGNQDATLHVWRIGKSGTELSMSGYPTKINTLAFSPDSTLLASGGGHDVTIWDFNGEGPRGSTPQTLRAHEDVVTALAWSPGGELLAAAAGDGRVAIWQPRRGLPGRPLSAFDSLKRESAAAAVSWDRAGRLIAGWADATVAAAISYSGRRN